MDQIWLWVGFNLFVLAMLAVDLFVFHKDAHEVSLKEAAGKATDDERLERAKEIGCTVLKADSTRDESLRSVRINRAKLMIISAGRDDTSILICLTARHLAPDLRIGIAVNAQDNEIPARRAGADIVVNPLDFAGLLLATSRGGQHIADYAGTLKENQEEYNSRFSAILKNGLSPEDYPSHFEEIKSKISGGKMEKPAPKKTKEEEAPAPAPKEKKEAPPAKEEKKAPKEKKEEKPKKKEEEQPKEEKKKSEKAPKEPVAEKAPETPVEEKPAATGVP